MGVQKSFNWTALNLQGSNYLTGGSLNLVCQHFKLFFKYYLSSVAWKKELHGKATLNQVYLTFWRCRVNKLFKTKAIALLPEVIFLWLWLREHIASSAKLFNSVATLSLKSCLLKSWRLKGGDISTVCTNHTMCYCGHVPVRVRWDKRPRGQRLKPCTPSFTRHEDHQAALVKGNK